MHRNSRGSCHSGFEWSEKSAGLATALLESTLFRAGVIFHAIGLQEPILLFNALYRNSEFFSRLH